jgi:hypothetical protein
MTVHLPTLLGPDGVRTARELVGEVDKNSLTRWVASGSLVRPLPGVLALPSTAATWHGRATAAVRWSGGHLCGRSALALWDLVGTPGPHVHLAVGRRRSIPVVPDWLRPHRVEVPAWGVVGGFDVTLPARSVVEAWGHAHSAGGTSRDVEVARSAVIGSVQRRVASVREIHRELARRPSLPGRAALVHLVELVAAGSHSELEIWGLTNLLEIPGLPPVQLQLPLRTRISVLHLDAGWRGARLGVELDSAAFHGAPDQRETDLRRDAAALAEGWAILRISRRRGTAEPAACRAEIETAFHRRVPR